MTPTVEPLRPFVDYVEPQSDIQPHLGRLRDLACEIRAQVIVELGVRHGLSSAALVYGAVETDGHVWAVEVDEDRPQPFTHPRYTFIHGHDQDEAVIRAVPGMIDLLFIDTSHTLWDTARELTIYGLRVRTGGLVVCHDTELPGVRHPLTAFMEERGMFYREWPESHGLGVVTVGPREKEWWRG